MLAEQLPELANPFVEDINHLSKLLLDGVEGKEAEVRCSIAALRRRVNAVLERLPETEYDLKIRKQQIEHIRASVQHAFELLSAYESELPYPQPQVLPFEVLPPGEGDENDIDDEYERNGEGNGHDRVSWGLDELGRLDDQFDPSEHFFVSTDVDQTGIFHVLLSPSYGKAVFIANEHRHASYVCPYEEWDFFAHLPRSELKNWCHNWEHDPRDEMSQQITRFSSSHGSNDQRIEDMWKMRLRIELERNANILPVERKSTFEDFLERIKCIKEKHGRLPRFNSEDSYECILFNACVVFRYQWHGGILTPEQIEQLEEVGIGIRGEEIDLGTFEEILQKAKEFKDEHGRLPRYNSDDSYENNLAYTLQCLRASWRGDKLDEEQIEKLKELGIGIRETELFLSTPEEVLKTLEEFRVRTGHNPSYTSEDSYELYLYSKISSIRRKLRDGEFSEEQRKKLMNAGILPSREVIKFDDAVNLVAGFYKEHSRIPNNKSEDEKERRLGERYYRWRIGKRNRQMRERGETVKDTHRLSKEQEAAIVAAGIPFPLE